MDQNNKAVKVIRFFCKYAMDKAVDQWIEMLPGGQVAYMTYELGKGIYEILSNADIIDRDEIFEATMQLSNGDIQSITREFSDHQANQIAVQETLETMQKLGHKFSGQTYIQTEVLREQINQILLTGRQQISAQSFNMQQKTIGAQVAHALTLRGFSGQGGSSEQLAELRFNASQAPQIQGFELKGILGKGSYAMVYLAVDLRQDPHQTCALKVGQIDEMIRFEREVKNMKAIKHANVLSCLDSGTITHQGRWYYWISMENMRPITVQDLMRDLNLSSQESKLVLLKQIVSGLSALHQTGILHRDLKPANCLISEHFEVKLSDFGLSKNLSQQDKDHTINSSQHYQALGTPAYMSPEQILGENVGLASDVWSFGVIAYEMFTGELPFQKANNPTVLMANILKDHVNLDRIKGKIDQQVIDVIQKCLEKDIQKRYANGVEVAKAFLAVSQAEIQKINDARYKAVWQKVLDQGMIEKYAMECIQNRRVQTMGVEEWQQIHPQIIVDFKRLGRILEQIKKVAIKKNWESLVVVDVENNRIRTIEELDRLIAKRERYEEYNIKAVLSQYSQQELLDKLEEVSEMKKKSKVALDEWSKRRRSNWVELFDRTGNANDILDKIKGMISAEGSGLHDVRIIENQANWVISLGLQHVVKKEVEVEVIKKGLLWDKKVIEKKLVEEEVEKNFLM